MRGWVKFGSHFIASLFLFYLIGCGLTLLLYQSRWIDMRFESEYVVTVAMGFGFLFYFMVLFMNARGLAWWTRKRAVFTIGAVTLLIFCATVLLQGRLLIIPGYLTRKAWFLEDVLTLSQVNAWLLVWVAIGLFSLALSWRVPLQFKQGPPMDWQRLGKGKRMGTMAVFGLLGLFILLYLGQGGFRYAVDQGAAMLAKADVAAFRDYLRSYGALAAVISALLMVFQSVIAPLPAFVITFANGLLFGWVGGAALSWSSAMAGAVLCYYLAKFFGRPVVSKLVSRSSLEWADRFFERYGSHAVFIARIVPVISFDLVSYAAGLTSIRFWHFFIATGLGQLPATLLYSYLGQTATGAVKILFLLFTIVVALAVLGAVLRPKFRDMKAGRQEVRE